MGCANFRQERDATVGSNLRVFLSFLKPICHFWGWGSKMTSHSLGWSEKDLHEHNTKQRTTISNTATIERVGTKLTICLHIAANTEMVRQTFFNEKRSTNLCRPIPSFRQNAQIFLSSLFSYRKHTQTHFTQLVAFHYSAFYYHTPFTRTHPL